MITEKKPQIRHTLSAKQVFCPHCLRSMTPATWISGWLVPEEYQCESCGYTGSFFLEDP